MSKILHPYPETEKMYVTPNSDEWRTLRLSRFSSSSLFKLMGKGRAKDDLFSQTGMTYIYEKVSETFCQELPEQAFSKAIEWGHANETFAIQEFTNRYRQTVETGTFYNIGDRFCGTPDGETVSHILEIKCPYTPSNHIENFLIRDNESFKKFRPEYYWQVQANMWLAGKSKAAFISFDPRQTEKLQLHAVEIELDSFEMIEAETRIDMAVEIRDSIIEKLILTTGAETAQFSWQ